MSGPDPVPVLVKLTGKIAAYLASNDKVQLCSDLVGALHDALAALDPATSCDPKTGVESESENGEGLLRSLHLELHEV